VLEKNALRKMLYERQVAQLAKQSTTNQGFESICWWHVEKSQKDKMFVGEMYTGKTIDN
jgi:hypothetical protein